MAIREVKVMDNMKVLIIAYRPSSYPGGVERVLYYLERVFSENGAIVHFLTRESFKRNLGSLEKFKKVKVEEIILNYFLYRKFNEIKHKYDLVITNGWVGAFINHSKAIHIYHGTMAGYARALRNHSSKLSYFKRNFIIANLEKMAGRNKYVVCVSNKCKNEVELFYGLNVRKVIVNCADEKLFFPRDDNEKNRLRVKLNLPQNKPIILFVGTMEARKGIDIIQYIAKKIPKFHFLICSDRLNKRWMINASNAEYRESLSLEAIKEYYQSVDILLFPSRYEGFPLVAIEALACGIPIVASDAGAMEEIKERDEELGRFILTSKASSEDYINTINWALDEKRRLSNLCRKYFLENNSYKIFKERWEEVLKENRIPIKQK